MVLLVVHMGIKLLHCFDLVIFGAYLAMNRREHVTFYLFVNLLNSPCFLFLAVYFQHLDCARVIHACPGARNHLLCDLQVL